MELPGVVLIAGVAVWVYRDARARNAGQPGAWAVGTSLLAILVLPVWLLTRPGKGSATTRPCPFCAETVKRAAVLCRHCGRPIEPIAAEPVTQGWSRGFKRTAGALGAFVLVMIIGALAAGPPPSRTSGAAIAEFEGPPSAAVETSEVAVRVAVSDDTARRRPGAQAEIWFGGVGSWFPDSRHGGDVRVLGKRPVGTDLALVIYPDGRDSTEITVPFRLSSDMCPDGCARDTLMISVRDDHVEVVSLALMGGTSRTFKR